MYKLLRFSGALIQDPAITEWFDTKPPALSGMARSWFVPLRNCGADVRERMHDGCPVACVEDAPFGYVNVFTSHAAVGFFHGAALPDPDGLLVGTGRYMRHVKIRPGHPVDASALEALIREAYRDIHIRVEHEHERAHKIAAHCPPRSLEASCCEHSSARLSGANSGEGPRCTS